MKTRIIKPLFLFIFFAGITCSYADTDNEIAEFKQSWAAKAMKLQRELDVNAPFHEATFLGTHNSYNSKSYAVTAIRYVDPNQTLSIFNQLEMGIRSIEFDAHWTLANKAKKEILLCHGRSNHTGCSIFDRKFIEGLSELREWLLQNPDEIVFLYIERKLDGHESDLANELNQYVGEFIYKPTMVNKTNTHARTSLPTSLNKAMVLKAKKQLIIVTKDCASKQGNKKNNALSVNDFVFAGIGNIPNHEFNIIDSTITDFDDYPKCGKSTIFKDDANHLSMWRIFEDQAKLSGMVRSEKVISPDNMRDLMRCNINFPTVDMLTTSDPRLEASIWSWEKNYPKDKKGECVIYKNGLGFENIPCNNTSAGYACQEEKTHALKTISLMGTQQNGEINCQMFAGKNWHFATPVNGAELADLATSMKSLLLQEVWLNYKRNPKGNWVIGDHTTNRGG